MLKQEEDKVIISSTWGRQSIPYPFQSSPLFLAAIARNSMQITLSLSLSTYLYFSSYCVYTPETDETTTKINNKNSFAFVLVHTLNKQQNGKRRRRGDDIVPFASFLMLEMWIVVHILPLIYLSNSCCGVGGPQLPCLGCRRQQGFAHILFSVSASAVRVVVYCNCCW